MNNTSTTPTTIAQPQSIAGMNLPELVMWCILNGFVALFAIFGNSLVIAAFSCFKKLRTRTNHFVVGLAAADILVGLISIPFWIASLVSISLQSMSWMESSLYRVFIALDVFSGIGSILHLLLISLERLYAIGWPVRHRVSSRRSYLIASSLAWTIAFGTAMLFIPENNVTIMPRFFFLLLCFLVPLTLICITYIAIWIIVKLHDHDSNYWSSNKEVKLAFTLSLVILLFIAAWTPFMVINIIAFVHPTGHVPHSLAYLTKLLHYSNSAVNPALYGYRLPEFKKAFYALLIRRTNWRSPSLRSQTSFEKRILQRSNSAGKSSSCTKSKTFGQVAEDAI